MSTSPASHPAMSALRRMHGQLARMRWRGLGLALQLEVLALFALISAFVFWQARLTFAALWMTHRASGTAVALAVSLTALAAACAAVVAANVQLIARRSPLRTLWTNLPLDEQALAAHLRWESRIRAVPLAALSPTLLLAAWGYTPPWIVLGLGAAFVAAFFAAARTASIVGIRLAPRERERAIVAGPFARALLVASSGRDARPLPAAGWSRRPAWFAWWRKDATVAMRSASDALGLLLALMLGVASALVWSMAPAAWPRYLLGLLGAVAAVIVLAEWVVALAGHDPFVAVRSLPLGPAAVWTGRFLWVALFTAFLLVLHLGPLGALRGPARSLYALWLGGASLSIGILAVNYGVTLFPNARTAQRLLGLAIGLSALAMFVLPPVSGLVALGSGLIHSARRLPRWHRLEEA